MSTSFQTFARNINSRIEPPVRKHLAKVYLCLTATTAIAAVGAYIHLYGLWEAGLLSAFGSLGLVLALHFTPDNGKNFYMRLGFLLGFGLLSGHSLGPLLSHVIALQPQIIVSALIGTSLAFVSFSLSALLAERGRFLFLGGVLMSVISTMALFGLANLFFKSVIINQAQMYIGLGIMSAFILYDTQAIMEKCRAGNRDFVGHSLELFFDLVSVFRRLLIILTQKEERERRRKNN